ncbi:uncharacterized protein LOC119402065 [Rhipicephalus sanguineus]|uniref:uncharacterized protein LOC119402065 n=1 Tax=Rhipicephalus sanguineus TaxID=34632 RepID=UPI0018955732|nr:uncharacterized protein LOC119402065 [Rhipicephalus sanguineus]XP_037525077.1 uncharacterized protein LOC119402065 [Rhipicephalus sanguineus]
MKTHRAISILALFAISAAVKPWTLDLRCRILITGAETNCSSLKYYYNTRKRSCESTCFEGAPFRLASTCKKSCRSRKQPPVQSSVPGNSGHIGSPNTLQQEPSKSPAVQAPLVTKPSWSAVKIAVPLNHRWPEHTNMEVMPENYQLGAEEEWPPSQRNDGMALSRPHSATPHWLDTEARSQSLHLVPSEQYNTAINTVNQQHWSSSSPNIALVRPFPQRKPPLIPESWTAESLPRTNQHVSYNAHIGNNRHIHQNLERMPWKSHGLDNDIMPEFPLRLNNKIVPREQSWRRNSQPNEEVGRLNRLQVNEQTWALGDTNNGMVHSPVEQTMPVQLNDDAEDSFPEEIPVSDFAISSPVGVQVIPQLLQRDQRDFQTSRKL